MKKLYSAIFNDDCFPFNALCSNAEAIDSPDEITEPDSVLIVWGGADIDPAYYGHPRHTTTYPGGMRDRIEWGLMQAAIEKGIPIIGVCRGAQMACAAAGGFLIQNVNGHGGYGHLVKTKEGDEFRVNSIHHQMMAGLNKVDHDLLAWTNTNLSTSYGWKNDQTYVPEPGWHEPEMVYFKAIKALAIQWHPEGMSEASPATHYILKTIKEKMENDWKYQALSCAC